MGDSRFSRMSDDTRADICGSLVGQAKRQRGAIIILFYFYFLSGF